MSDDRFDYFQRAAVFVDKNSPPKQEMPDIDPTELAMRSQCDITHTYEDGDITFKLKRTEITNIKKGASPRLAYTTKVETIEFLVRGMISASAKKTRATGDWQDNPEGLQLLPEEADVPWMPEERSGMEQFIAYIDKRAPHT
ncbi:hypothetical protein HY489_01020 [Candidatus Woesearchaeota archaeon]|nr:hypothetical protein [Candidatus Woesearchaeota archaeon]